MTHTATRANFHCSMSRLFLFKVFFLRGQIVRRFLYAITCWLSVFLIPCLQAAASQERELVVLHTNDLHGHPVKFRYNGAEEAGGLPALANAVTQIRSSHENVLVLDAGDLNTGMPESNYFKAVPDIIGLNYIGYDAMTLGNHEFDNPINILRMQQRMAAFAFLSANVKAPDGKTLVTPYIIKNFKGLKVAIFGITLKEARRISNPHHVRDLVFEDEIVTARQMVSQLRPNADLVLALVHMGVWQDDSRGSRRLAASVKGIDLIIDGHSHTDLARPLVVNGTPIVQAFQWGLRLGKGIFKIRDGAVTGFDWESIPINTRLKGDSDRGDKATVRYPEDPLLLSLLAPYAEKTQRELSEVIGYAEGPFPFDDARRRESELGDLIADSMRWFVRDRKPDFALHNGGGIRAPLHEGQITKRNVYEVLPFDNTLVVLVMKGSDVEKLFDHIALVPNGGGGFPQVSEGVSFTINYGIGRCENIIVGGSPLEPERLYTIVTNSYLAAGGDGYDIFLKAQSTEDTSVLHRDALSDYISKKANRIRPSRGNRIAVVP